MPQTEITDYRLILKTALDRYVSANGTTLKKEVALTLHMSPSLLARVLRLERNIPLPTIEWILSLSILTHEEKERFMRDYIAQMLPTQSIQKFIRNDCKTCAQNSNQI